MLGHLMEWFHAGLGGLGQEKHSIAYKHLRIAPRLIDTIKQCNLAFESPYGKVLFQREDKNYTLEIPVNSLCTVVLPTDTEFVVNNTAINKFKTVRTADAVELELGSGIWEIVPVKK